MSLYMDLLKSSNDEIKKMLRDKRLAKFLIHYEAFKLISEKVLF